MANELRSPQVDTAIVGRRLLTLLMLVIYAYGLSQWAWLDARIRATLPGLVGLLIAPAICALAQLLAIWWFVHGRERALPPDERSGFARALSRGEGLFVSLVYLAMGMVFLLDWYNLGAPKGMEPTLAQNEGVTASPVPYLGRNPDRGDLVVASLNRQTLVERVGTWFLGVGAFSFPGQRDGFFLGRVVGLAGESIAIRGGQVWVNGVFLDEPYLAWSKKGSYSSFTDLRLGPRDLLLLGDDRTELGGVQVSRDAIYGQVFQRWLPVGKYGFLEVGGRSSGSGRIVAAVLVIVLVVVVTRRLRSRYGAV